MSKCEWRNLDFVVGIYLQTPEVCHQQLSGAAEARRAHNPEGNGSKPFSAITFVFVWHFSFALYTPEFHFQSEMYRSQKASWKFGSGDCCERTTRQHAKHSGLQIVNIIHFSLELSTLDITCTETARYSCNSKQRTCVRIAGSYLA